MADEVIIARFTSEIAAVKKQLEDYIATQGKVQAEEEKTQKEISQTATTASGAARRRTVLLKQEIAELKKLEDSQKRAFSPGAIDNFNKKIAETKNRIASLKGETQSTSVGIKASLTSIAGGFAAAFSLQQAVDGAKAAVNAFLEAEESANKLKFAVTQIAGEGSPAFDRLIEQASKLQEQFGIADETIQAAQSALLSFGLSSQQVEKAIPALVDFAAVTGQDIPSAVQSMGQAIQGRAGDFKKFGVQVSETSTEVENFNAILEGLASQQGAAAKQAETLTGQLKRQQAAADELQESIGSRLADSFTAIRFASLKLIETFIKLFDTIDQRRAAQSTRARELLKETIEANIAGDAAINNLTIEQEAQKKLLETGRRLNEIKKEIQENPALFPRLDTERKQLIQTAGILSDIIALKKDEEKIAGRLLTADSLRAQSLDELNRLLKENQAQTSIEAQSNVKLITRELDARKKAAEELRKLNAETAKLAAEQYEKAFQDLKKSLENGQDELLNAINAAEKKIKDQDALLEFKVKITAQVEGEDAALIQARDALFKIYQDEALQADVTSDTVEEANAKKQKSYEQYIAELTKLVGGLAMFEQKETDNALKAWLDKNAEIIDATTQLVGELNNLYGQIASNQISRIEKETDKELDALDAREEANEEALKRRAVSEKEFAAEQKRIEADKAKTQEAADKKIREIKRKQFIADKVAALAEIIISTAKNVAEFPQLAAFYLAIGAAQGAIVAAQPVPYRKGTKSAKGGLSLVDEEGSEAILRTNQGKLTMLDKGDKVVPARKTKQFSKVFDAIIDDRFEDYVLREYVTPRLQKQKQEFEKQRETRMTDAITRSIVNNTTTNTTTNQIPNHSRADFFLERMAKSGVIFKNIDQLADVMNQRNRQSPKR